MDAAQTTKKIALFLAAALLMAGAASAQTLTVDKTAINFAVGFNQDTVTVGSSDGTTPLSFAVSTSAGWFTVQQVSGTLGVTPATLRVQKIGDCSPSCTGATITITHSGADFKTITV